MRWLPLAFMLLLVPQGSQAASERVRFTLTEIWNRDWIASADTDWRRERFIEGIDWQLGTVSRGDAEVMTGGFTVVHPYQVPPFSLRHCYVLAAFDLAPHGYLLVAVRDPQYYWTDDPNSDAVDPIDLVWYDENWVEEDFKTLPFGTEAFPDNFRLSPDRRTLLALTHPVTNRGELSDHGQGIKAIDLRSGQVDDVWLPEVDGFGNLPAAWWPVKMQWGKHSNLEVQAGAELRIYQMRWE
jgi:hypothetical protein